MDIQSIFNAGGTVIKNPNYKKGKKNTQPEYITVSDLNSGVKPDGSLIADIAYNAAAQGDQDILGRGKELDKYVKHGLTPNDWENLDKDLAEAQGFFTKAGNSLAQAIVSEVGLGTLKGFSDLVDLVGQATGKSDGDYTNPVSQKLEEWQEEFREYAPIYRDESLNISNGGLTDAGWWFSNLPSVLSSLTLLIPSSGIVKTASSIGKYFNVGARTRKALQAVTGAERRLKKAEELRKAGAAAKEVEDASKLNKLQRFVGSNSTAKQTSLFLENTSTAILSRAMENYQEARGTYNDMYAEASERFKDNNTFNKFVNANKELLAQKGIDSTDKDAVAKFIAAESADRTFQLDWANVVFDVWQMYGLRNAWKGLKNADGTPTKVRRANLDAAKYAGKTKDEIKALKAGRKFKEKAKEWAEDRLYGSKLIIGAQLSEGVEEGVNYIATQEGMHYGNVMLGKEVGTNKGVWENILNGFDGRLAQYVSAPELWDSAFWGTMGGILFQAGGSKLRQLSNKIKEGKSKADEKAKETLPWYKLDQLPENKRRIGEIEARMDDFNDFRDKAKRILDGENIYAQEKGKEAPKFTSEEEQATALDKLKEEFIAKITLRAMNTGNYDMLKAYLSDENLHKAIVESGILTNPNENKSNAELEADATAFMNDALRRMERVERMYDEEIHAVNYASSKIMSNTKKNADSANYLLGEYIQIIAHNNVLRRLDIDNKKKDLADVNARISTLLSDETIANKLDKSIDYEGHIRTAVIANALGQLYAEKRRILNDNPKSLSNKIALENINKQIEVYESKLDDAQLVLATQNALRFVTDEKGNLSVQDTEESAEYTDKMIVNRLEGKGGNNMTFDSLLLNTLSKRASTTLSDATFGEFEVKQQDFNSALGRFQFAKNAIDKSESGITELDDLYKRKTVLENEIDTEYKQISKTVDEVEYEAGVLHNSMSEMRQNAIDSASDTILELYDKYGDDMRQYLYSKFFKSEVNDEFNANSFSSRMSSAEKRKLNDALDVLALTKSYNRSLLGYIDEQLNLIDVVKATQEEKKNTETSQENATNQNGDTSNQVGDLANSSSPNITGQQGANNGQNEASQQQIDPQNITNRNPAFSANFYDGKGKDSNKLIGKTNKTSSPNSVDVYDNGDGTFTIDVKGDAKKLNDPRYFGNTKSVVLSRPNKVSRLPIAVRNSKGNLVITQPGELVNTDTLEYQEQEAARQAEAERVAQEQAAQQGEQVVDQPQQGSPQVASEGTPDAQAGSNTPAASQTQQGSPATNPSTGGVVEQGSAPASSAPANNAQPYVPTQPSDTTPTLDYVPDYIPDESDTIRNESIKEFQKAFNADNNANLDEVAQKLIDFYIKSGVTKEVAEGAVNKALGISKRVLAKRAAKTKSTMFSSIDEVTVAQYDPNIQRFFDAVKDMINNYAKEFGLQKHNGKYYVNLEDLLRYINTITNDATRAEWIFDSLKTYIESGEGKNDFAITDADNLNDNNYLANVSKSASERYLERLGIDNSQRVDIDGLVKTLAEEKDIKAFYNALDSINKGDKLTYTVNNGRITIRTTDGRAVGALPIPKIDAKTGAYKMVNDGWVYDILPSNNGEIISKLKDTFMRWFNPQTEAAKELSDLLYELCYDKPSKERKAELLEMFKHNAEVKLARVNGFISPSASNEQLLNGLYKLWKFKDYDNGNLDITQEASLKLSLNNWFDKVLLPSYEGVMYLVNNPNTEITVSQISDGEIIRISDTNAEASAIPADKALAGGVNTSIHKIGMAKGHGIEFSGMPIQPMSNVSIGSTFVLIPNRSGNHSYIQAFPAEVTDDYISKDAKEIIKAVKSHFNKLLSDYSNDPNSDNFENIKAFVKGLFYGKNINAHSIFYGLTVTDKGNIIVLENPSLKRKIVIKNGSSFLDITHPEFDVNENGYKQKTIAINSDESKRHVTELINNLRFNINPNLITSDNNPNMSLNTAVSRNKDGKFVITIGEDSWTYDSYNDFILSNNLVKLNTKPNEAGTSNYNRKGLSSQKGNQVFRISINKPTTSPVKGNESTTTSTTSTSQIPANKPINEQIDNILKPDFVTDNKGEAIASLVFTQEELNAFKVLGILPKTIIFDEKFNSIKGNETYNAKSNVKTGEVTVGTKWLEKFKNPNERKRAIRILIHEQLHIKLHEDKNKYDAYINSIKQIYKEFEDYLDANNVPADNHIRAYLFKNYKGDEQLEEFLVETLTNEELARYLNGIDAKSSKSKGAKNLFQKILELLSDIFGWKVREGSLYEKELNTLRSSFSNNLYNNIDKEISKKDGITTITLKGQKVTSKSGRKQYNPVVIPLDIINTSFLSEKLQDNLDNIDKIILTKVWYNENKKYNADITVIDKNGNRIPQTVELNSDPLTKISLYKAEVKNDKKDNIKQNDKLTETIKDQNTPKELDNTSKENNKPVEDESTEENEDDDDFYGEPEDEESIATPASDSNNPYGEDFSDDLLEEFNSSVDEEVYSPEMQSIKDKAIADGTFMKAPNGKPTNLNERQWLQVRTKNFINWFGDWEKFANITEEELQAASLIFDRVPELAKIGTPTEYAAYIKEIFPNSVEKEVYWHGSNEDFSEGFASAKRGEGSGALETKKRNDLYLNKQGWASLQYVNGINRKGRDKNGFAHWNKLWWELKEIMSNGRRENNDWKDIVIDESTIRQAIPNKKGVFNRDSGGKNGKWLSERKADYGYENKSDKEFFEEIFGIKLGKDTFNTWTARNAEIFKSLEKSAKGINPVVIDVRNPIIEEGQNTYYEEQRGLFTIANAKGNDAILSKKADNEFNSDVAVVINANNDNVYWLGTKSDIERFRQWKTNNNASKVVDENGEPLVVYHNSKKDFNTFKPNSDNYIYFTSDAEYAKDLKGGKQYEVFINLKNPLDITGDANILWEERNTIITEADYLRLRRSAYNYHFTDLSLQHTSMKILRNSGLLNDKDGIIGYDASGLNEKGEWLYSEGTEYVVFNPNQAKSATNNNGDFSTTNNDIRYSSVDEVAITAPSVQSLQERLPVDQQPQFAKMVASADIETSCR